MRLRHWIITIFTLLALSGCNNEGSSTSDVTENELVGINATESGTESADANESDAVACCVQAVITTTDKFGQAVTAFSQGEPITISVTLTNVTEEIQTLEFSSAQQYDFSIKNVDGFELWRWSSEMVFAMALTSYSLEPGESRTMTIEWDQKLSDGTTIPVGEYILEADSLGIDMKPQLDLGII